MLRRADYCESSQTERSEDVKEFKEFAPGGWPPAGSWTLHAHSDCGGDAEPMPEPHGSAKVNLEAIKRAFLDAPEENKQK